MGRTSFGSPVSKPTAYHCKVAAEIKVIHAIMHGKRIVSYHIEAVLDWVIGRINQFHSVECCFL